MSEPVARCGTCGGRLESWQRGVCSDQCSRAVTDIPDDEWSDDVFDFRDVGGVVDGLGIVHSDADPGL